MFDLRIQDKQDAHMRTIYYFAIFGVISFFASNGLELMWENLTAWHWFGMAIATTPLLAVPAIWDNRHNIAMYFRSHNGSLVKTRKSSGVLMPLLIMVAMVLGLWVAYGALLHYVKEEKTWNMTHPSLSLSEQKKVDAECSLKAMDRFGASNVNLAPRLDYKNACLRSKGFVKELNKNE